MEISRAWYCKVGRWGLVKRHCQVPYSCLGQFGYRVNLYEATVPQNANTVAQGLSLGQHMGREQHGTPVIPQVHDDPTEFLLDQRVETACGFINDIDRHVVLQRTDNGNLLLIPHREITNLARRIKLKTFKEVGPSLA